MTPRHGAGPTGRVPWRRRLRTLLLGLRRRVGMSVAGSRCPGVEGEDAALAQPGPGPHAVGLRVDRSALDLSRRPRQGRLGDCWVMASLLAVHECSPDLLGERLTPRTDETVGVRLGAGTSSVHISVDRSMPIDSRGRWVYGRESGSGPGWVGVFEKALAAHLAGSYGLLARGIGRSGLQAVTGSRVRMHLLLPSPAQIATMLAEGRALLASTHPLSPLLTGPDGRFPGSHVMAVVGADPVNATVDLRNPWRPEEILTIDRRTFRLAFVSMDVTAPLR